MTARQSGRAPSAGVTLVEVLVALALFALVGVAGFSMLDQVLRTQRQTDGRLEDLAAMQRALHLITLDFSQARPSSVTGGAGVSVARGAPVGTEGQVTLRYRLDQGTLWRDVAGAFGLPVASQALLGGVTGLGWQFHDRAEGWVADWPIPGRAITPGTAPPNPQAVAVTITRGNRQVHRIVGLPGAGG